MISQDNRENVVIGYKQVLKAAKSGLCEKIFLSEDCSENMSDAVLEAAGNTPVVRVPSMRELGKSCGIDVSASCAAVIRI